jgi:hypothetical protein
MKTRTILLAIVYIYFLLINNQPLSGQETRIEPVKNHLSKYKNEYYNADYFRNLIYPPPNFNSALFYKPPYFNLPHIYFLAEFSRNEIYQPTNFNSAQFYSPAYFDSGQFHVPANFKSTYFYFLTKFDATHFYSTADFSNDKFNSKATFRGAQFDSNAEFLNAQFNSAADFKDVKFTLKALFTKVQFTNFISFYNCSFGSEVIFRMTILPDSMDFRYVKTEDKTGVIDFTSARLDSLKQPKAKKSRIALVGTDINKIKINYELFELYFPSPDTLDEQKIAVYEKLLQNFKTDGFMESYENLDIEYQEFKKLHKRDHFLNWFHKLWWNYGYNKEYVIMWSLIIFAIFSLINLFLFKKLQSDVYSINFNFFNESDLNEIKEEIHDLLPFWTKRLTQIKTYGYILKYISSVFKIYLLNPIIYTGILFFGIKVSFENFKKLSMWTLFVLLIFITGLFCLAYIFNIIIVK